MLNLVREGEEDYIEAIRYRRRLKIFLKISCVFFVLSVSCWNIRFGAICHFRSTNSSSSTENLRIVFTYFAKFKSSRSFSRLHLVDFLKRSPSIPVISLSASLCSARKLIKYSKPNAVRARKNAFIRDFPDFVCMPTFSCSSTHFTHFAIYQIIFGVGNFSRGFFVCSERKCSIFVRVLFCFYLLRL